jgi:hypothetical protein
MLHPLTRAWGEQNGAEFRDVGRDREAYFRLLRELWADGQPFMLVEQDNVPPKGAVASLETCHEPWCGCVYEYGAQPRVPGDLGCTRFSGALLQTHPTLIDESSREKHVLDYNKTSRDYRWLFHRLKKVLFDHGFRFHTHTPEAAHYHDAFYYARQNAREFVELINALRLFELEAAFAEKFGDSRHLWEVGALEMEALELLRFTTAKLTAGQRATVSQRLGMSLLGG